MRILVIGAGAIGGYFGGRLMQAGRDVTFLLRPRRAAQLASTGLVINSCYGDVTLRDPATVQAEDLHRPFDLILLTCKAYDLAAAIESFAPAVGPETMILPLLNGMKHLDILDERFGRSHVLGGQCIIAATLNDKGAVVHLNDWHRLSFGARASERTNRVVDVMSDAGFDARASESIVQDMWEKWVLLASLAGATCLMRASIGDILASPGGNDVIVSLLEECQAIAETEGHPLRAAFQDQAQTVLTNTGSSLTASMLRDMESNAQIEAEHIVGDLLRRGGGGDDDRGKMSTLRIAYAHMKAYEARRAAALAAEAGGS